MHQEIAKVFEEAQFSEVAKTHTPHSYTTEVPQKRRAKTATTESKMVTQSRQSDLPSHRHPVAQPAHCRSLDQDALPASQRL